MISVEHCNVCIRQCRIGRSFCRRRDDKGRLKQENVFCAIAFDYLFDKPILHFRNNEKILSIGSWGCNLRCRGCQNFRLSCSETGENLISFEMLPGKIVKKAMENDCKGICFTFNEPAIAPEIVEKTAKLAKEQDLYTVLVTNSTLTNETVDRISLYIDAVATDIKSLKDDFYYEYCGGSGIKDIASKILTCIKTLQNNGCHVEVRTNIITGVNDSKTDLRNIAAWISNNLGPMVPWHLTRFFPAHELSHIPETPVEKMLLAKNIAMEEGLVNVYVFTEKGCDCAGEKEIHDCCRIKN